MAEASLRVWRLVSRACPIMVAVLTGCASWSTAVRQPEGAPGDHLSIKETPPPPKVASPAPEAQYRVASGPTQAAPKPARPRHPPPDLCENTEGCVSNLKTMLEDPQRAWIARPEPPAVFANGVRLFAYRALRTTLTCGELVLALREIDGASKTFTGSVAGLKPEQVARVRVLCTEVGRELRTESAHRCTGDSKVG
jgi:hypothetical protein